MPGAPAVALAGESAEVAMLRGKRDCASGQSAMCRAMVLRKRLTVTGTSRHSASPTRAMLASVSRRGRSWRRRADL